MKSYSLGVEAVPGAAHAAHAAPTCATADAGDAVEQALKAIEPGLRRAARRVTTDRDLAEDLLQEARIGLWELDPTRFDLKDRDDLRYVCRVLVNRMWVTLRAEVRRGVG